LHGERGDTSEAQSLWNGGTDISSKAMEGSLAYLPGPNGKAKGVFITTLRKGDCQNLARKQPTISMTGRNAPVALGGEGRNF